MRDPLPPRAGILLEHVPTRLFVHAGAALGGPADAPAAGGGASDAARRRQRRVGDAYAVTAERRDEVVEAFQITVSPLAEAREVLYLASALRAVRDYAASVAGSGRRAYVRARRYASRDRVHTHMALPYGPPAIGRVQAAVRHVTECIHIWLSRMGRRRSA